MITSAALRGFLLLLRGTLDAQHSRDLGKLGALLLDRKGRARCRRRG